MKIYIYKLYTHKRSLKAQFSTVVKRTDCEARYSPCLGFLICKNEETVVLLTLRTASKIKIISVNKRKRLTSKYYKVMAIAMLKFVKKKKKAITSTY